MREQRISELLGNEFEQRIYERSDEAKPPELRAGLVRLVDDRFHQTIAEWMANRHDDVPRWE